MKSKDYTKGFNRGYLVGMTLGSVLVLVGFYLGLFVL